MGEKIFYSTTCDLCGKEVERALNELTEKYKWTVYQYAKRTGNQVVSMEGQSRRLVVCDDCEQSGGRALWRMFADMHGGRDVMVLAHAKKIMEKVNAEQEYLVAAFMKEHGCSVSDCCICWRQTPMGETKIWVEKKAKKDIR